MKRLALCILVSFIATTAGCSPAKDESIAVRSAPPGGQLHANLRTSVLKSSDVGTTTLEVGTAAAAPGIRTPKEKVAGKAIRVLVHGQGTLPKEQVGLGVLYAPDIEFYAEPGKRPAESTVLNVETSNAATLEDGSESLHSTLIAGHTVWWHESGRVRSAQGLVVDAPATAAWHDSGTDYFLRSDRVSAARLLALVQSMY